MKKEQKKPKNKGSKLVTRIYYICYFLLIIGYCAGMYFFHNWLTDELVAYEVSTQPSVIMEQIFTERFADPDWEQLYEDAGLTDTQFEDKETFLAYIASVVGEEALTYEETTDPNGTPTCLIRVGEKNLGYFTLVDMAEANALIPDWQLGDIHLYVPRDLSITVEKQDGHTVYVNGQPLNDSYTVEIQSTAAEEYLPEGTLGIRRVRQKVTGLLMPPEITILDEDGNSWQFSQDSETGIFTEALPTSEPITKELRERAIAAGEAYCTYMVEQDNYQLFQYFASGTETYRAVTSATPWPQNALETAITGQTVSDYTRYTDDLFSARVTMTMRLTRMDGSIQEYPLDATLFFENRKAGWMVISMTDEDITRETRQIRLTFMNGDTQLSTAFYNSDATEVFAPAISVSEGQVFSGWAEKEVSADGIATMNLAFPCDEDNRLIIPNNTALEPMTLYALFEDVDAPEAETESETDTTESEEPQ